MSVSKVVNAVCNPLVLDILKSPSFISSCFVPISSIIFVVPTTKSPVIDTSPSIEPPVSLYLLSNAACNPLVLAIVKSPSFISSCFVPISSIILVVPTDKSPVIDTSPQ